jgi:ribosomal protein S18 acetylase RimI-like enzyme
VTKAKEPLDAVKVHLRAGSPDDAARLATVFVSAWLSAYPGVVSDESLRNLEEEQIAAWLRPLLCAPRSTTIVAEADDGELLGFCRFGEDPDIAGCGHIFSLYVAPSASRRGLGHRLVARALEELERLVPGDVTLWVFEENAPARQLYSGFGFSPDGGRRVEPEYGAEQLRLRQVPASGS